MQRQHSWTQMINPEQNHLKPPRKGAVLDLVWGAAQDLFQAVSVVDHSVTGTTVQPGLIMQRGGCRPRGAEIGGTGLMARG